VLFTIVFGRLSFRTRPVHDDDGRPTGGRTERPCRFERPSISLASAVDVVRPARSIWRVRSPGISIRLIRGGRRGFALRRRSESRCDRQLLVGRSAAPMVGPSPRTAGTELLRAVQPGVVACRGTTLISLGTLPKTPSSARQNC